MVDLYSTGYFPKYIKVNQSEDFIGPCSQFTQFYFPKWIFAVHSIQILFKKIAQNMDFYQKMYSSFKFQQDALSIQDT